MQKSNTKLVQLPAVKYISLKYNVFQTKSLKLFCFTLHYITENDHSTSKFKDHNDKMTDIIILQSEYDSQKMVTLTVLALKNWHTWNKVPTFGSSVVDAGRMATEFRSVLRHCWLGDSKDIWPVRNLCYLSPMVLFLNKCKEEKQREDTTRNWLTKAHLENYC